MKKVLSITLSLIIIVTACLGFGTVALANNYSSAQAIQEELNKNKFNSSTPLTVTVTGTYNLSERLVIYSNTTFNCAGATFIKNYQNSTLLAIGQNQDAPTGNSYYKNITINGGTFDANKTDGSILSFAHASNVAINGATFKDCSDGHHLTFAGCDNINVTNCTFTGHGNKKGDNMEAVQLDILDKEHFPNYKDYPKAYDGTMNTNINITGNTFNNVNRGVGSHSVFSGKYMSNINISNNTFNNIAGYAILSSAFLNVNINNNVINNCGSGIYYKTINPKNSDGSRPNTYSCQGKSYAPTIDTASSICGNTITVVDTADTSSKQFPYGIRLYGENLTANDGIVLAGDYSAQNVNVSSNNITISRAANAIWLVGTKNINVSQNTVLFNNSAYSTKDNVFGLRIENSTNATINANTINANNIPYVQNVIILDKSKGVNIAGNKLTGAKKHGINLTSSSASISANTISGNKENGIFCYKNSTMTTNKNRITGNKKHGIFVNECKGKSKINGDTIKSNKQCGIAVQKGNNVTINSAKISKSGKNGIYIFKKSKATINKCTVSNNKKDGIYSTLSSTTNIKKGTVSKNSGNGIYYTNKAKGSINGVKIQKNKKNGIYLTKKVGKIKITKVKYAGNKGGKIQK